MVSAHDNANGIDMYIIVFLLPCLINRPANSPPNSAPSNDRLAIQEPCCSVIVSLGKIFDGFVTNFDDWFRVVDCNDANAGDVYPFPSPTENGPNDKAIAATIWNMNNSWR